LFNSPGDHVLTDVLGDQVNGVAVVHKILTSPFIDPNAKQVYVEATKRVLIELKVIATQAYRRLIEEVGLPVPNFQPTYNNTLPPTGKVTKKFLAELWSSRASLGLSIQRSRLRFYDGCFTNGWSEPSGWPTQPTSATCGSVVQPYST